MTVHRLTAAPPPAFAAALGAFEEQFVYPLGPGRTFRISHGEDYPRFFRAIGEGVSFVAERDGRVLGTLGAAVRRLILANETERPVLYLGDLKVAPEARGGMTLVWLARAAHDWAAGRVDAAFAVVMDGTAATPERYTGRVGVPGFRAVGRVMVLRVSSAGDGPALQEVAPGVGEAAYRRLSAGRFASPGGEPTERSVMPSAWFTLPGGAACGQLEDTLKAKRLIDDAGAEMRSAHLSCFAYEDTESAACLIRGALRTAMRSGYPALFVAVPAPDAAAVRGGLDGVEVVEASATVYGTGLEGDALWNINTAEI